MLRGSKDGLKVEDILCPGGMPAFIAHPRGAEGRLPVVVLMHERYGLVQHTRDLAMRCARDGFLTIAPDFFFKHPDKAALIVKDWLHGNDARSKKLAEEKLATAKTKGA
jgi:dienelactone hydrolase